MENSFPSSKLEFSMIRLRVNLVEEANYNGLHHDESGWAINIAGTHSGVFLDDKNKTYFLTRVGVASAGAELFKNTIYAKAIIVNPYKVVRMYLSICT